MYDPLFCEYEIYSESVFTNTFVVIQVSNTTSLGVYCIWQRDSPKVSKLWN